MTTRGAKKQSTPILSTVMTRKRSSESSPSSYTEADNLDSLHQYFAGNPVVAGNEVLERWTVAPEVLLYSLSVSHMVPPTAAGCLNMALLLDGISAEEDKGMVKFYRKGAGKLSDASVLKLKLYEIVRAQKPEGFIRFGDAHVVVPKVTTAGNYWFTASSHRALTGEHSKSLAKLMLECLFSLEDAAEVIACAVNGISFLTAAFPTDRDVDRFDACATQLTRLKNGEALALVVEQPTTNTKLHGFLRIVAGFQCKTRPWRDLAQQLNPLPGAMRAQVLALNSHVFLPLEAREQTVFRLGDHTVTSYPSLELVPADQFILMNPKGTVANSLRNWADGGHAVYAVGSQEGQLMSKRKGKGQFQVVKDSKLWPVEEVLRLKSALVAVETETPEQGGETSEEDAAVVDI